MTPEKQRIAIAEACGYKIIDSPTAEGFVRLQKPDGNPVCSVGQESRNNIWPAAIAWNWIPDYLNDLNAMHEAVVTKWETDPYFGTSFAIELTEVVTGLTYSAQIAAECLEYMITATAAQRAEAFLKTLGLWED